MAWTDRHKNELNMQRPNTFSFRICTNSSVLFLSSSFSHLFCRSIRSLSCSILFSRNYKNNIIVYIERTSLRAVVQYLISNTFSCLRLYKYSMVITACSKTLPPHSFSLQQNNEYSNNKIWRYTIDSEFTDYKPVK